MVMFHSVVYLYRVIITQCISNVRYNAMMSSPSPLKTHNVINAFISVCIHNVMLISHHRILCVPFALSSSVLGSRACGDSCPVWIGVRVCVWLRTLEWDYSRRSPLGLNLLSASEFLFVFVLWAWLSGRRERDPGGTADGWYPSLRRSYWWGGLMYFSWCCSRCARKKWAAAASAPDTPSRCVYGPDWVPCDTRVPVPIFMLGLSIYNSFRR